VVWIKHAVKNEVNSFPANAENLKARLRAILWNLKTKYPSVKIAYLSSRIFAYGATTSPEPHAYEGGFAVKWLVEDQINGALDLTFSGAGARVPWLSWGPYLWADGLGPDKIAGGIPGRSDGLEWLCSDFGPDGIHPDTSDQVKVADMLLKFFSTDSTAAPWFLR
jgi:hypothetical protein